MSSACNTSQGRLATRLATVRSHGCARMASPALPIAPLACRLLLVADLNVLASVGVVRRKSRLRDTVSRVLVEASGDSLSAQTEGS